MSLPDVCLPLPNASIDRERVAAGLARGTLVERSLTIAAAPCVLDALGLAREMLAHSGFSVAVACARLDVVASRLKEHKSIGMPLLVRINRHVCLLVTLKLAEMLQVHALGYVARADDGRLYLGPSPNRGFFIDPSNDLDLISECVRTVFCEAASHDLLLDDAAIDKLSSGRGRFGMTDDDLRAFVMAILVCSYDRAVRYTFVHDPTYLNIYEEYVDVVPEREIARANVKRAVTAILAHYGHLRPFSRPRCFAGPLVRLEGESHLSIETTEMTSFVVSAPTALERAHAMIRLHEGMERLLHEDACVGRRVAALLAARLSAVSGRDWRLSSPARLQSDAPATTDCADITA